MNSKLQKTPIAVIGMASLFPQAKNLSEYWSNIINEVDCITDVPSSRWNIEDYYDPDPKAPDKTYCKRGGFIPDIDFNPMEFGLPPNILELTDVSQLLSLVVAKEVMADAGYSNPDDSVRKVTGVILGATDQKLISPLVSRLQYPLWERVLRSSGISDTEIHSIIEKLKKAYIGWELNSFPGFLSNVIAGRIADRLDLGGINSVVSAACASSLSAINMAVNELLENRCQMMITGGVDVDNSIFTYLCFSKTPMLTSNDKVQTFDAEADGTILGEGIGMVVLKRLEDAERDNDRIYATIRGIGSSTDGKTGVFTPRSKGQATTLKRAYRDAGFAPASIGLFEANSSGTVDGDMTEFAVLKDIFGQDNPQKRHIALGSVKSQIGHTKAAAGAAGFIKAALALHHKILPPTINVTKPHSKLNIENSPFYLNTKSRPWFQTEMDLPRRAGVSSFGFGGTSFHFVLEEYKKEISGPYRLHKVPQSIILSATTPERLLSECHDILRRLESDTGINHYQALPETCKSTEIPMDVARIGFITESLTETCEHLKTCIKTLRITKDTEFWNLPEGIYYRRHGIDPRGKITALFPGKEAQYPEMGKELVCNFPPIMDAYSQIDRLFLRDGQDALSQIVFPKPEFDATQRIIQEKRLQQSEYTQPAIGVFSAGLYKLLRQSGFQPDFATGYGCGELTALWVAGVITDEDYLTLAKAKDEVFARKIQNITLQCPQIPVYSNVTGEPYPSESKVIQEILANYMRQPIKFREKIENIYKEGGTLFVEFSPQNILTKWVGNILKGKPHLAIALNADSQQGCDRQLRQAVIQLRVAGLSLHNIDPYQRDYPVSKMMKQSPLNVKLNGGDYVSEKTRKNFENAL